SSVCFFFSSRRRHTRFSRDWSSDVCSSDLALISFVFPFYPSRHWQWIAILLSLVVLGGMGSLKGAVVGALGLAVISSFVSTHIGAVWAPITFFGALFLMLMVKPEGLFGKKARA